MSASKKLLSILTLFLFTGCVGNLWYSPLTAIPVGPSGPPSSLSVTPHDSPSTAIKVTASSEVKETDFQWIEMGLPVPSVSVKGVEICYKVESASPGTTYISQIRVTKMTTPDYALVVHDDGAALASTSTTCYTSTADFKVQGTATLQLKMVFGSTSDSILVGGIQLVTF